MKYFTQDFLDFFKELAKNNNKEWFHASKPRYETSIKKPYEAFLIDLINEIQKIDSSLNIEPKDCVLRINKDIRFSKDKSPYNLHYTAFVSNGGRKDKSVPGIFLRFGPEEIGIMGGCFGPDKDQLSQIRQELIKDPNAFQKLLKDKSFETKFNELEGEKIKRIPKELEAAAKKEPLVLNKQYYFVAKCDPSFILKDTLIKDVMEYWKAARPINDFLANAICK